MYLPPSFVDQTYAITQAAIIPTICVLALALLLYRSFDKSWVWRGLLWAFGTAVCAAVSLAVIFRYFYNSEAIALRIIFLSPSIIAVAFLFAFFHVYRRHLQMGQRTLPRSAARAVAGFLTIMFAALVLFQVGFAARMYYLHSRVSFYSSAEAEELEQLSSDYLTKRSHYIQSALISHPKTPFSVYERLLMIDDANTLIELAFNGATPPSIIEKLRVSKYESVRRTAAQNRYSR